MRNAMYCKYCGNKLFDNDKFCSYCGRKTELISLPKKSFKIPKKYFKIIKKHFLYIIPIIVFIIVVVKINSISGHWYLTNAEDFMRRLDGGFMAYHGPSQELYFNSNGSFSDSDDGSILGTYKAQNGILTLYDSQLGETTTMGYKIKWGKLYIYAEKQECIYSRRISETKPESDLLAEIVCEEDEDVFSIYNMDIAKKAFITNNSIDDTQYRYGIQVQLNSEQKQLFENFTKKHLSHDVGFWGSGSGWYSFHISDCIVDGKVIIAYFHEEAEARQYYDTIKWNN